MAIRFRTSIFVAFGLLCLYFVFWRDDAPFRDGSHTIDVLKGASGTQEHEQDLVEPPGDADPGDTAPVPTKSVSSVLWQQSSISSVGYESTSTSSSVGAESSTSSAVYEVSTGLADGGNGVSSAVSEESSSATLVESSTGLAAPEATSISADGGSVLQTEFEKEYDALGL